ncbi:hypothetical protein [Tenacibaculum maritimum]|uniref:hypothetical protein n=1 Tax=Tenacibaculum maritimum TaxID=107401 RepID=UPI0038774FFF
MKIHYLWILFVLLRCGPQKTAAKVSPLTEDRDMLLRLRKRYLHFSSMYGSVSGSNIPNYTIHENTIIRKRQVY